jgi:hypothetical protein
MRQVYSKYLIGSFALTLPGGDQTAIRLPPRFSDLQPYVDKWAIRDDARRGDLLAKADEIELREIASLASRLDEINRVLDNTPEPIPPPYQVLQDLAESVADAIAELRERGL